MTTFPAVNPGFLTGQDRDWPLEELAEMGYAGLEVRPDDLGRGTWWETARELGIGTMCVNALPILTPYLTGSLSDAVSWRRKRTLDRLSEVLSWMGDHDVPFLVVAPGRRAENYQTEDQARDLLVSSLAELASSTEAEVLLESAPFRPFSTSPEILEIINEVDAPNVWAAMDVGHAMLSGEDPAESSRILGSKLRYLQIRDLEMRPGRAHLDRHLPLGRGSADISRIRRLAEGRKWSLCISAPHAPVEEARIAMRRMKGCGSP
jgi:sugar phosphate isomerase/epimerase